MNGRFEIPPSKTNPAVIQLLKSMLESEPTTRLSSAEIWSIIDGIGQPEETKQGLAEVRELFKDLPAAQDT